MMPSAMRLGPLAVLLVLSAAALAAGDGAEERVPGTLTLADGVVHTGSLRTTDGHLLTLLEPATARRLDLRLRDIARIRVHVAKEEMAPVWRWVEDGSREKVFTGESYPRREYETEIVLRNGEVRRGHLTAVLYLYPEGKEKPLKFLLRHQHKGEVGETLKDLSYVETVVLDAAVAEGAGASLRLTVTPADRLLAAHALPRGRDRSVEGAPGRPRGVVVFSSLVPDVYDLVVVTRDRIHAGLGVGREGGKPLDGEDLAAVSARVREIEDFFEEKAVLAAVREGEKVRALVLSTRTGPTSMGGDRTFRRYDVWSLSRSEDRWLVDGRSFVHREQGESLPPPREVRLESGLAGHAVKAGTVEVALAVSTEVR